MHRNNNLGSEHHMSNVANVPISLSTVSRLHSNFAACPPNLKDTLRIAFETHQLGQGPSRVRAFGARAPRLLIGIAKRNNRAHQALLWNTEQRFRILSALPFEPADARTNPISFGGQHDALAQPSLVIGLLVNKTWLSSHHQDHSQC